MEGLGNTRHTVRFPGSSLELRRIINEAVRRRMDRRPETDQPRPLLHEPREDRWAMRPDQQFLFPAIRTRLQPLGPLSLTGMAQRTGPHRPVAAGPAAMQA